MGRSRAKETTATPAALLSRHRMTRYMSYMRYWRLLAGAQVFPAISSCAARLKIAVASVRDAAASEDDLKTMANMYSVALENEIRKPGRCAVASQSSPLSLSRAVLCSLETSSALQSLRAMEGFALQPLPSN